MNTIENNKIALSILNNAVTAHKEERGRFEAAVTRVGEALYKRVAFPVEAIQPMKEMRAHLLNSAASLMQGSLASLRMYTIFAERLAAYVERLPQMEGMPLAEVNKMFIEDAEEEQRAVAAE